VADERNIYYESFFSRLLRTLFVRKNAHVMKSNVSHPHPRESVPPQTTPESSLG
jgi:hypothetical protein